MTRWANSSSAYLHGDDRQLQYGWTLFIDPIEQKIPLGPGCHSGRLHDLHRD